MSLLLDCVLASPYRDITIPVGFPSIQSLGLGGISPLFNSRHCLALSLIRSYFAC